MSGVPQLIGLRGLAMTIRRIRHGYEVKIPLLPEHLLVLNCDSLKEASRLDKVGRPYERTVHCALFARAVTTEETLHVA